MTKRASLDPDTFGSTSAGTSAGTVKSGGTYSPLEERGFYTHRLGIRGGDTLTNTGTETFGNTYHNYDVTAGNDVRYPIYNRPINTSRPGQLEHFINYT